MRFMVGTARLVAGTARTAMRALTCAALRTVVLTVACATAGLAATAALAPTALAAGHVAKAARSGRGHAAAKHHGNASAHGERNVQASIRVELSPPSEKMPETNKIVLYVPERFKDAGAQLPSCTPAILHNKGPEGCPKRSVVGNGTSIGYTILGGQFVEEHLKLTMVNGPKASLLSWVEGRTPVSIEEIVEGVITKTSGFGLKMSFTIPHGLLEPVPGAPGWLHNLNANISGKSGWLRSSSCPTHPWSLKAEFGYAPLPEANGLAAMTIESKIGCV